MLTSYINEIKSGNPAAIAAAVVVLISALWAFSGFSSSAVLNLLFLLNLVTIGALLPSWVGKIRRGQIKDTFVILVGLAILLAGWRTIYFAFQIPLVGEALANC